MMMTVVVMVMVVMAVINMYQLEPCMQVLKTKDSENKSCVRFGREAPNDKATRRELKLRCKYKTEMCWLRGTECKFENLPPF